ncbi:MAG: metallophosphoesterase family protein [Chloroflexi bacterium]|nr:metallophosphoesterase family protein [Chloroflexota bacterium]
MRIGVVSDTHLPRFGGRLPKALMDGLREARVELILHAGDLTELLVIDQLETIAPVEAVTGNNDGPAVRERYPRSRLLHLGGFRLGLVHGDGKGSRTVDRALRTFTELDAAEIICFGHSHIPLLEWRGATLVVNPGSPTDKRRQPRYSYATIDLQPGGIQPRHHFFDDRAA